MIMKTKAGSKPYQFEAVVGKLADRAENLLPSLREGASIHDAAMLVAMEEYRVVDSASAKIYAAIVTELFNRKRFEEFHQKRTLSSAMAHGYTSAAHSATALAKIEDDAVVIDHK
ncbi:MAG: hypothetical protein AAB484_02960 [Patescibacteria group bacterium]